jgi:hypothetical protein
MKYFSQKSHSPELHVQFAVTLGCSRQKDPRVGRVVVADLLFHGPAPPWTEGFVVATSAAMQSTANAAVAEAAAAARAPWA